MKRAKKLKIKERNETSSVNVIHCPIRAVEKKQRIIKNASERKAIPCSESDSLENSSNVCLECFENYEETKSTADWIQCVMCKNWLHETCTMCGDYCNPCQRLKLRHEKIIK